MSRYARLCFAISAPVLFAFSSAQATVTISKGQTKNMVCTGGVCSPTAENAVLGASYLKYLLDFGSVTVTTTGSNVQANDIVVTAPFAWLAGTNLTLDAYHSIAVGNTVDEKGAGGVSLVTNDGGSGGTLSFSASGSISIDDLSAPLTINGTAYTLVNSLKTLAADVALNPSGNFALAESIDASSEGTFRGSAIPTTFTGTFQGLGNTIYDLAVYSHGKNEGERYGLFAWVGAAGTLEYLNLGRVSVIESGKNGLAIGTIVGENDGTIIGDSADGVVQGPARSPGSVGGLVGDNEGIIITSHSSANVSGGEGEIGGLVGIQYGTIASSYATGEVGGGSVVTGRLVGTVESGSVTGSFATGNVTGGYYVGGLIGALGVGEGTVANCYATGAVSSKLGGNQGGVILGGFVGFDGEEEVAGGSIAASYSTGTVSDTKYGAWVGGFAGSTGTTSGATDAYWDTTTSGTDIGVGSGDSTGITGLTTTQFQSGLPAGFDSAVWAENPNINNGLPYLIANPPQE